MKTLRIFSISLFCFLVYAGELSAQATLSFQGILKKSNGVAVDDGEYSITFNLYNAEQGGTAIWSETQTDVEVSSGIYSVLLGSANPLNVSFNEVYYLGVKIGGTPELSPRLRLTSAPYALSLIGQSNQFPSAGLVKADEIATSGKLVVGGSAVSPTHTLLVTGGVLARSGAPGANGDSNNGYAFDNDKDSGLFSTADGELSVFVNNVEKLEVSANNVAVTGNQSVSGELTVGNAGTPGNVNLSKGGAVVYNGNRDWVLVATDDFENGDRNGWVPVTGDIFSQKLFELSGGPNIAINQGYYQAPTANGKMRKTYDLTGIPHNHVKVEFTVIAWGADFWDNEAVVAGFSQGNNETTGWQGLAVGSFLPFHGEMVLNNFSGNSIGVFFTSFTNELGERIAVGNVEVYVR